jgi:N-acetyl-anhydromuramyl-L-alanine amidase AmpD
MNHGHREGMAYHVYIEQDGKVYFGTKFDYRGSHAYGRNNGTIGVCLSGDFRKNKPTDKQLKALVDVLAHIKKQPHIHPKVKILTHSEVMKLKVGKYNPVLDYDCPGDLLNYLKEYLDKPIVKDRRSSRGL